MSAPHCNNSLCKDGNCPGCSNGKRWCEDPDCFPYCRACELKKNHEETGNWVVGIILVVMFTFFIIAIFLYGPRFIQLKRNNVPVQHSNNGDWVEKEISIF